MSRCRRPLNYLLLRTVNDKVHAPDCRGGIRVGGLVPHAGRAAAEQGRQAPSEVLCLVPHRKPVRAVRFCVWATAAGSLLSLLLSKIRRARRRQGTVTYGTSNAPGAGRVLSMWLLDCKFASF